MALNLPQSAAEISQKAKTDIRRELPDARPFVARSYLGAIVSGLANRLYDFYGAVREAELESNPATSVENLTRWASIWDVTRLEGQTAQGLIWVDSTLSGLGVSIPINTRFTSGNGSVYVSQSTVSLVASTIAVTSLTQASGVATCTTTAAHNLASNALITITGTGTTGYPVANAAINVTSATTFTFSVPSSTAGTATGTPVVNTRGANVSVKSEDSGSDQNVESGGELTFETPIVGVSSSGNVTSAGIADGIPVESDDDLRTRMLERIQNPVTPFNVAEITAVAREIPGVTRVFVTERSPVAGRVTVRFMRDNDTNPIPSPADVTQVKDEILKIKPAHISDTDVVVSAPSALVTDFTFTALSPNTEVMQAAIRDQLEDFFARNVTPGVPILQDAYRSAIYNTIDSTGSRVVSFTLSAPTGTLTATGAQIRTLGSVAF